MYISTKKFIKIKNGVPEVWLPTKKYFTVKMKIRVDCAKSVKMMILLKFI